jgi:hypothetical protein
MLSTGGAHVVDSTLAAEPHGVDSDPASTVDVAVERVADVQRLARLEAHHTEGPLEDLGRGLVRAYVLAAYHGREGQPVAVDGDMEVIGVGV